MLAFGFSINVLTMFGMVLTIGLLVDDAIVVVENVERLMSEEGLSPKEATSKSMGQITGALVGIALVLAAVFIPMAFFGGSTGVIYRQFSITMASAMLLSVIGGADPLAGAVRHAAQAGREGIARADDGLLRLVQPRTSIAAAPCTGASSGACSSAPAPLARRSYAVMIAARGLPAAAPADVVPAGRGPGHPVLAGRAAGRRHAGAHAARCCATSNATSSRTRRTLVQSLFTVAGFSFSGSGQNAGIAFVTPAATGDERPGAQNSVKAVAGRAMAAFSKLRDAMVFAFAPPAVLELGVAQRLRHVPAGSRRRRTRRADGRAQSAARHWPRRIRRWSRCARTGRKTRRSSASRSTRARAGALGLVDGGRQRDAVGGLGQRLRQ